MTKLLVLIIVLVLLLPPLLLLALAGVLLRAFGWRLPSLRQVGGLLFNRDSKRNLALAHATVNHLEGEHGPTNMVAQAAPAGFRLDRVPFSAQVVAEAAVHARRRLLAGESGLRLHRRHAGSTLIGVVLGWLLVVGLLLASAARPPQALVALLLVLLLSGWLGRLVQRGLTTRRDVGRLQIGPCELGPGSPGQVMQALVGDKPVASYWVPTFPVTAADQATTGGRLRVTVRPMSPGSSEPSK